MAIAPAASPQKSVGQIYCVCALIMSEIHPPLPVENNTYKKFGHESVPALCDHRKAGYVWKGGGKLKFVVIQLSRESSVFLLF